MNLRVAGAQLPVIDNDVYANKKTVERAIDHAADEFADILLTPEGMLSGYDFEKGFSFPQIEEALGEVTARAKRRGLGLALGVIRREADGNVYNELRFYAKNGLFIGYHSKILRCSPVDSDEPKGELLHCSATPLSVFEFDGIKIGGLLCNDMWGTPTCTPMPDPHLAQQLSRMGAKVIFHGVNGGRDGGDMSQTVFRHYHESNLRIRAMAARAWIVVADNAFPTDIPNSCAGGVIKPDGEWHIKMPTQGKQYFVTDIEV